MLAMAMERRESYLKQDIIIYYNNATLIYLSVVQIIFHVPKFSRLTSKSCAKRYDLQKDGYLDICT
jgi:hypothetical protein